MSKSLEVLALKLKEHSRLTAADLSVLYSLSHIVRELRADEDLIRQGDQPKVSAVVLSGMVARYHLLANGARQYLSFHMAGDMPDSQAVFIEKMDHAVCAVGDAMVALVPHKDLIAAFDRQPTLGFAIWRETLIYAAIFRDAITNNSSDLCGLEWFICFASCITALARRAWRKAEQFRYRLVESNWARPSECRLLP